MKGYCTHTHRLSINPEGCDACAREAAPVKVPCTQRTDGALCDDAVCLKLRAVEGFVPDAQFAGASAPVDLKIASAAAKVPFAMIPASGTTGAARVFGYGGRKYKPGNYYLATLADGAGERYVSGALRHLAAMQNPDGTYTPESLAARDEESGLPHLDHMICGLIMLRTIMVKSGALPVDPGVGNEPPAKPAAKLPPDACPGCREHVLTGMRFDFPCGPSCTRVRRERPAPTLMPGPGSRSPGA